MKADDLRAAGVQLEQVATVEVVVGYLVTPTGSTGMPADTSRCTWRVLMPNSAANWAGVSMMQQ